MEATPRHPEHPDHTGRAIHLVSVALARVAFTGVPPGWVWPSPFTRTDGR